MLLDAEESCVLLVDVQEKLTPLVHEAEQLIANCRWVLQLASELKLPILVSEQYPQGLGATLASLREVCASAQFMQKTTFSCIADETCTNLIEASNREQIILIGIETHVCVLQTAIDLFVQGKEVYVVADVVSARNPRDTELALSRMREMGIQIISKEMLFFEWLQEAGTDTFKRLSKAFL